MSAWWTVINGETRKHDNQRGALFVLFAWRTEPGVTMALYNRDPSKPGAVDLLPGYKAKAQARELAKQLKAMSKRGRK